MLLALAAATLSWAPHLAVQEPAGVTIERRDLAPAFLRLDRAFARRRAELTPEQLEAANVEMDLASLDFFGLRFASALRRLERARRACLADPPDGALLEALASLRIDVEPRLRVTSLFAVPAYAGRTLAASLRVWTDEGPTDSAVTLELDASGRVVPLALPPLAAEGPRPVRVALVGPAGGHYASARTPFAGAERLRAELLADVREVAAPLENALRVYRARVALVKRTPALAASTIELLLDPAEHVRALRAEAARLRAGEDPYAAREGGLWRTVPHGASDLPLRVFAPAGLAENARLPLVVAFHGAGGDENFFHAAGGAGRFVELAREHRFLLASPRTTDYTLNPKAFDSLLTALAADYPVDPERVFLVGHSLGAMTAANLLKVRGERIARAVCISGARALTTDTPVLVLAGKLDKVVPAAGLERTVARARERGLPVELELFEHQGHTLFLPTALERAVQWLGLTQR